MQVNIEKTLKALLQQEDTIGDKRITVEDKGPKKFVLKTNDGESYTIEGTYHLSNLLQELVLAKRNEARYWLFSKSKIEELPVTRISRMIKTHFWDNLTRTIDRKGVLKLISDTKNSDLTKDYLRIYVPYNDTLAQEYYTALSNENSKIKVVALPKHISPNYVNSINDKPGILSLQLTEKNNHIAGEPFVVPGGRFNEMYGWDSYFEALGLIIDKKAHLAQAMANNFRYQIEHYGKILNANRSYYLTRTQPPFYTSLIRKVFKVNKDKQWLKSHLITAIKEYETVWMVANKRLCKNGLNRYFAEGIGITPESEEGHYDTVIQPYAQKKGISTETYIKLYIKGDIINEELDNYFIHDRTVRESGHDTSYRIEGNCAHLNLVDLNALLYKYEKDFARLIQKQFNGVLNLETKSYSAAYWLKKAKKRKKQVNTYLWHKEKGLYFDFNFVENTPTYFVSATTFYPLWAKLASKKQAKQLIKNAIPLLKQNGGIVGCSKQSLDHIPKTDKKRQWDYPYGWAPHQMLVWEGLIHYKQTKLAQELIYRWLYLITKNAVDYNGTISEKYDVVNCTHKMDTEYGNVGTDFKYVNTEGFGWMNASYKLGIKLLKKKYIKALNALKAPDLIFDKN